MNENEIFIYKTILTMFYYIIRLFDKLNKTF